MRRRLHVILLWMALLALGIAGASRARFTADLSAFLPSSPTSEQQLLVDLLREGMVSRLILVGIEGGDESAQAQASKALAARLRQEPDFVAVNNGEALGAEAERAWVFSRRYALSPAVSPERFTAAGLRAAIGDSLDLLASSAGLLVKPLLTRDPTAETLRIIESMAPAGEPRRRDGVWVSRDGRRALLLATTRATGSDSDGQALAIAKIRAAFAGLPEIAGLKLEMTGPGVFAVAARHAIEEQATRLAIAGSLLIVALLAVVYRSATALLLGLVPVASGAVAGVVAVSLGFGVVHGVTLGFGITLIGEAVDYAIYFFLQARSGGHATENAIENATARAGFWRTIRLGVATSVCGFGALLATGFPGLAQLGLFTIAGLVAAVLATRYVLPALMPANLRIRDLGPLGTALGRALRAGQHLRWLPLILAALAASTLAAKHNRLWHHELAALSPVSAADQALDASLRADLGAPDVRYLVVASAADQEGALQAAERLAPALDVLQAEGAIAGYDSPARFLPSLATQAARQASLPGPEALHARLAEATRGLPLSAARLPPFAADVAAAREAPPIRRADLAGTAFGLAVDALLLHQGGTWRALMPLKSAATGPSAQGVDDRRVAAALAEGGVPGATFIDLKRESDRMYAGYLREAIQAALGGVAAIVVLLLATLRSPARVLRLLLPLAAAVLVVTAALALAGERLTLLHLVGMLLVVAVGSNYALFFDASGAAGEGGGPSPETLASLLVANLATLAGFGILALSSVPVLHAIGVVVGPGAFLALVFSALLTPRRHEQ
jgi:predicted exporter